jgi:O-antigen/teichoic acid export membrane protein
VVTSIPFARWLRGQRVLLVNAGSMVGSIGVTSVLGFVTWWLAARLFTQAEVGLASAAVAAMTLLATVSTLGLGTLLMGELPRRLGEAGPLISTALLVASGAGLAFGAAFFVLAPLLAPELARLGAGPLPIVIFSAGAATGAAGIVLDQALVGLLRGGLQLRRNIVFGAAKLAVLPVALLLPTPHALTIYGLWALCGALSIAELGRQVPPAARAVAAWRPDHRLARQLGGSALGHHALNLTMQAPAQLLPLVVTATLSARHNAAFYIAWMLASFVFTVPVSLATVLYTVGTASPQLLAAKIRTTLVSSLAVVAAASTVLTASAPLILGVFGPGYVSDGSWCLRIIAIAALPMIVRTHFVAICRLRQRTVRAAAFTGAGGALELGCAMAGAVGWGLTGLAAGWLCAMTAQALLMAPVVYRAARPRPAAEGVRHTT